MCLPYKSVIAINYETMKQYFFRTKEMGVGTMRALHDLVIFLDDNQKVLHFNPLQTKPKLNRLE